MKNQKISNTSERLKYVLKRFNLRQVDILKKAKPYSEKYNIKFEKNDLSQYVSGKTVPGQEKLTILAQALNVSEAWLLGYDVPMEIQEEKSNAEFVTYKKSNLVKMPIIGTIPAGTPIEAIQDIDEDNYLYIPESRLRGGKENYFLLRIKGNSMNPKYQDGDVILFNINPMPNSGTEVAVMVNGDDATFKQIFIEETGITLHPYNALFKDMSYSVEEVQELPIRVIGVVQSLEYRDLRG